MRKGIRVFFLTLLGLLSTAVLGAATALVAAVSLAASTALIVPGTGTPNANDITLYMPNFRDYYMQETTCTLAADCELEGVDYFASFWPIPLPGWCDPGRCEKFDDSVEDGVQNLRQALEALQDLDPDTDDHLVIAGYSQGARVVSIAKTKIASGEWAHLIDDMESVQFVFIGNPNRPNGGILSRFGSLGHIPILDVTTGQPTPTDTDFPTEDWAIRWEGIADFPQYLLNPLAVINSILGFYYDHGTYLAINGDSDPGETPAGYTVEEWEELTTYPEKHPDLVQIQKYGDTTYYTIRPKVLPLVRPLHAIPLVGKPIADFLEPILEVLIEETGYNRNIPFGQYSPIGLIPFFNPITLVLKLIPAVFQGVVNFLGNFIPALAPKPIEITPTPVTAVAPGQDDEEEGLRRNEVENLADADEMQRNGLRLLAERGDANEIVLNLDSEGDLTLAEGGETPGIEGAIEGEEPQGTGLEPTPIGNPVVVEEKKTDPAEGNAVVAVTQPEVKKDSGGETNLPENRIDADGRSVSLDASPNRSSAGPANDGAGGTVQRITPVSPNPSEDLTTTPAPAGTKGSEDTNDSENSQDSQHAA
ncbi:hypothetical protein AU193_10910 [Mycobacterium sp. GA-1285]|uniref:PE-PPE domain-containing protein n=1 Tax=Mycobacterium sp. GA-1285 TaxID=1772282 RepID=UPI000746CD24|nr:PE-PPE domain-containing protein [Mycobacterium sp. GA-1285]KUI22787.1 hypothetical protein AU193_10910 [Mycobacterium sp. GA-1285]